MKNPSPLGINHCRHSGVIAVSVVGAAYMRPSPFVAYGSHIYDPCTLSDKAISRRRHSGIAGVFKKPEKGAFVSKSEIHARL